MFKRSLPRIEKSKPCIEYHKSLFSILYFVLGEIFPVVAEEGKYFFVDRDMENSEMQ